MAWRRFLVFEEILSFFLCSVPIFYGMLWAMMIAGEACQAVVLMIPLWIFPFAPVYISHRTYLCTYTTLYATVYFDMERFVGHKIFNEECSHRSGEEPRDGASHQLIPAVGFSI